MTTLTKAVRFHDYGAPDVMKLETVPSPVPAPGQIRLRVLGMGVNPVDWKIREGLVRKRIPVPLPAVPGGDVSGVVDSLGEGVSGVRAGESLIAYIGLLGAYQTHVVIDPAIAAPKPANLDAVAAAAIPLAGLTAWQALHEHGRVAAGQRVLIHGAAGGVGAFAVQFARHAGAQVVGTASPANHDYVRSLGAARVIDYRAGELDQLDGGFDLVLDTIGGETGAKSLRWLRRGGTHAGIAPPPEVLVQGAQDAGLRIVPVLVHTDGPSLRAISALVESGAVRVTIAGRFPLAEAGRAHEFAKAPHAPGKVVLTAEAA